MYDALLKEKARLHSKKADLRAKLDEHGNAFASNRKNRFIIVKDDENKFVRYVQIL